MFFVVLLDVIIIFLTLYSSTRVSGYGLVRPAHVAHSGGEVCGVCGVCVRARACACVFVLQ